MLVDGEEKARIKRRNRRVWVRGWIARRQEMGAIHRIVQELATEVPSSFMEYLRMDEDQFNHLVSLVLPLIKKRGHVHEGGNFCSREDGANTTFFGHWRVVPFARLSVLHIETCHFLH